MFGWIPSFLAWMIPGSISWRWRLWTRLCQQWLGSRTSTRLCLRSLDRPLVISSRTVMGLFWWRIVFESFLYFWGVIRVLQSDINICNPLRPPNFQLPTSKLISAGPDRSWCLLLITGFSATKRVTVCYQPGQAERQHAPWV